MLLSIPIVTARNLKLHKMGRSPCCDKVGLKTGRWTAEEDHILINYIKQNGEGSWRSMPKNAGLLRCGKSCRLRWINYLRSDLKRGNFTTQEQDIIIKLHATLGNKWSVIANQLPGRTDNEIKNYWNSTLSRRIDTFRRVSTNIVGGVMPQVLATGRKLGSTADIDMKIMNGPTSLISSGAAAVNGVNNHVKSKGKGRTSRAAMKKNKRSTNDTSNKSQQVAPQHAHESNVILGINASHLSSSNSSCLSRCHSYGSSITNFGTYSSSLLTFPQTQTTEHGHQGLSSSLLLAESQPGSSWLYSWNEDVLKRLVLDTSPTSQNDIPIHKDTDGLVDLDAYCEEVDLSFENNNVHFYDKLVVEVEHEAYEVPRRSKSNDNNSFIKGGEEMIRKEPTLEQQADNTQSSGFEDSALASADCEWEWETIVHQYANDNQLCSENVQDGTITSWLWDYTANYQQDNNGMARNQKDEEHKEAVVAWLLS